MDNSTTTTVHTSLWWRHHGCWLDGRDSNTRRVVPSDDGCQCTAWLVALCSSCSCSIGGGRHFTTHHTAAAMVGIPYAPGTIMQALQQRISLLCPRCHLVCTRGKRRCVGRRRPISNRGTDNVTHAGTWLRALSATTCWWRRLGCRRGPRLGLGGSRQVHVARQVRHAAVVVCGEHSAEQAAAVRRWCTLWLYSTMQGAGRPPPVAYSRRGTSKVTLVYPTRR